MQGPNDGVARALHLTSILLAVAATGLSLTNAATGASESTLAVVIGMLVVTCVLVIAAKVLYWWPRVSVRRSVVLIHRDPVASELEVVRRPGGGQDE